MSAYRKVRAKHSLLEICRQPELAAEVTLQPVDAIEVDAAILFSDLLLPLEPMGIPFDFVQGEGPVINLPVRSLERINQLRPFEPREALRHVLETIRLLGSRLTDRIPLIGFAGAPFTMASYAIEGGPSNNYARTKALMYSEPRAWHNLADLFATVVADYLTAQVDAGVQAVQLFDSWVGALSPTDYREFVLPHSQKIFDALRPLDVHAALKRKSAFGKKIAKLDLFWTDSLGIRNKPKYWKMPKEREQLLPLSHLEKTMKN